jgi:hypothetical protein
MLAETLEQAVDTAAALEAKEHVAGAVGAAVTACGSVETKQDILEAAVLLALAGSLRTKQAAVHRSDSS